MPAARGDCPSAAGVPEAQVAVLQATGRLCKQAGAEAATSDARTPRAEAPAPPVPLPPGGAVSREQRSASLGGARARRPAGGAVLAGGVFLVVPPPEASAAPARAGGAGPMPGEER